MRSFGEIIKSQRQKIRLTQKQVADSIGVSDAYICSLESEKRMPPPFSTVAAIADILMLDVDWLWKVAAKQREEMAVEKSRRKTESRRRIAKIDDGSDQEQEEEVSDDQINAFFERPEIKMATFGMFQKQPEAMSIEEKRIVFQAISKAQDFIMEQSDQN